jgi:hypothetical protein
MRAPSSCSQTGTTSATSHRASMRMSLSAS